MAKITSKKSKAGKTEVAAKSKAKPTAGDKISMVTIGPPQLTRFEKARIIGTRSLQLSLGAPPFVKIPPDIHDPIAVAMMELSEGVLPISIRRSLPDGRHVNIPLSHLSK